MRSPGWADGACLAAGALQCLAFAPFNHTFIAVAGLAVLFRAVAVAPPARAFFRGWLFGFAAFGAGLWWVTESFQYQHVGLELAIPMVASLAAALGLWPALFGALVATLLGNGAPGGRVRRLVSFLPFAPSDSSDEAASASPDRRRFVAALWWLPAAWIAVEWLRGELFTGFTWLQLGYAALETPLAAWAPVAGSYAAGLVLALTAAGVALIGLAPRRALILFAAVVLVLWGGAAALVASERHAAWTRPAGEPLPVLVVQGNFPQGEKWTGAGRVAALERYEQLTAEHPGARLVVWPESALPHLARNVEQYLDLAGTRAARGGYVLLAGIFGWDAATRRPHNSVVRLAAPFAAEPPSYYHKHHLLPFAEALPFERAIAPLARSWGLPAYSFASGAPHQPPLPVDGHTVAVSICYEIAFGAESAAALGDAALLVNVSNDAWFGDTIGPHQHFQIARMRALEQGRWLVRATNTGISALVSPAGETVALAPQFEATVLEGEVQPLAGRTPYVQWRDAPVLAVLGLMFPAGWWAAARRRGRPRGGARAAAPPPP